MKLGTAVSAGREALWEVGLRSIRELETDSGILASGREEIFGCTFGRDSLITALKLLRVAEEHDDPYFLNLVKKILHNLAELQGKEVNIESGEEPGKIIHEFRPTRHEHLTQAPERPWFLYPDSVMRNYDSVDSTPLFLIAAHEYYHVSKDEAFIERHQESIQAALTWLIERADTNRDGFVDYRLHPDRTHGGLVTQSWMDSAESVFHEDGSAITYPVAPVEVQAYAYSAFIRWSEFYSRSDSFLAGDLKEKAAILRVRFNERFVLTDGRGGLSLAFSVDGAGKPLTAARSSMSHVLWASYKNEIGPRSILDERFVPLLIQRLFRKDLFVPGIGIRTLSSHSAQFKAQSYHNGSIWPHDCSIFAAGLEYFGYHSEAREVRLALLSAFKHYQSPLELFVYSRGHYREYKGGNGQKACRTQAWSAGALLVTLVALNKGVMKAVDELSIPSPVLLE